MEYKQVILVRKDLNLPKGKMAVQVAHASVKAVLNSDKEDIKNWEEQGMPKVVLKVKDKSELFKYIQPAKDQGLVTAIIKDAGRTVVKPGTITCGAIGPHEGEVIDNITGELSLI